MTFIIGELLQTLCIGTGGIAVLLLVDWVVSSIPEIPDGNNYRVVTGDERDRVLEQEDEQ